MIVGTRGSALALAQTKIALGMLEELCPGLDAEIRTIKTVGDRVTDRPLSALGGIGAFVKELDQKIVEGNIDVAVNSLKDMPMDLTPGTVLAAVLPRGPVEDVLLSKVPLKSLPIGATIGSSSVRRRGLLLSSRPDLEVRDLRGNVPTRISKWKAGEYDAIVLAWAGMKRLGINENVFPLDPREFVPAVGQGAIAVVCAEGSKYLDNLSMLNDVRTRSEVEAERYVLRALGGGCSVPIGVWASTEGNCLRVRGAMVSNNPLDTVRTDVLVSPNNIETGLDEVVAALSCGMGGDSSAQ